MAISFSSGNSKQKYLIFVFIAVILVMFFVLKQSPSEQNVSSDFTEETYASKKNKINVDFEVLSGSVLQNFTSFEELQIYPEAADVSLTPSFSWAPVDGSENYVFEIIGVFSTTTGATSLTLSDSEKLKPSETYTWRVKACNSDQSYCGAWSSRSFDTLSLLASPSLTQPSISEVSLGRDNPFTAY
jgi:hypothetical protein